MESEQCQEERALPSALQKRITQEQTRHPSTQTLHNNKPCWWDLVQKSDIESWRKRIPQASLLIVQGQFRRFSIKIDIKNRFGVIFDYNIIWKSVQTYWLDETDRSVASGGSNFRSSDIILMLDNSSWRWTINIDAYSTRQHIDQGQAVGKTNDNLQPAKPG